MTSCWHGKACNNNFQTIGINKWNKTFENSSFKADIVESQVIPLRKIIKTPAIMLIAVVFHVFPHPLLANKPRKVAEIKNPII